jgi:tetratricopeptide (TPR) repeat protein
MIDNAVNIAVEDDTAAWQAHWLTERARIALARGQPAEALIDSQRAAVIQRRLGDRSREATAIDVAGQAYQHLDRPDDAASFHRRAATVHRDLGDAWQLAGALDQLATALVGADERVEAQRCRQEAVSLLAEFDDPPALTLRQRISRQLAADP